MAKARRHPWRAGKFDRHIVNRAVWASERFYTKAEFPSRARAVLIYLVNRWAYSGISEDKPMTCYCAQGQIAADLAYSVATVKRAIRDLNDLGFIRIEKTWRSRQDGSLREFNRYTICLPERVYLRLDEILAELHRTDEQVDGYEHAIADKPQIRISIEEYAESDEPSDDIDEGPGVNMNPQDDAQLNANLSNHVSADHHGSVEVHHGSLGDHNGLSRDHSDPVAMYKLGNSNEESYGPPSGDVMANNWEKIQKAMTVVEDLEDIARISGLSKTDVAVLLSEKRKISAVASASAL